MFQHVASEPPRATAPRWTAGPPADRPTRTPALTVPAADELAGVVVMGGPMGRTTRRRSAAGRRDRLPGYGGGHRGTGTGRVPRGPAAGGRLRGTGGRGPEPEVGLLEVEPTEDGRRDPLFSGLAAIFPTCNGTATRSGCRTGALLLARLAAYPQAFAQGSAYGLQFHLEADVALASQWLQFPQFRAACSRCSGRMGRPNSPPSCPASRPSWRRRPPRWWSAGLGPSSPPGPLSGHRAAPSGGRRASKSGMLLALADDDELSVLGALGSVCTADGPLSDAGAGAITSFAELGLGTPAPDPASLPTTTPEQLAARCPTMRRRPRCSRCWPWRRWSTGS